MIIYRILSTILFLISLPLYAAVRACRGKYLPGWKEKLGKFHAPDLGDKVIMFHGVSVGEVIALENLIKKTKETFPEYKIVLTTGTKTGQEIAHKKFDNVADFITYFPFDITICVELFLKKIKPSIVLIAETELWPTFAAYCHNKNIPLFVINGRISDSTFKSYRFIKGFFKEIFKNYTSILTQSEEDKEKFIKKRLKTVVITKLDENEDLNNLKSIDVQHSAEYINMLKESKKSTFEKIYDNAMKRLSGPEGRTPEDINEPYDDVYYYINDQPSVEEQKKEESGWKARSPGAP